MRVNDFAENLQQLLRWQCTFCILFFTIDLNFVPYVKKKQQKEVEYFKRKSGNCYDCAHAPDVYEAHFEEFLAPVSHKLRVLISQQCSNF